MDPLLVLLREEMARKLSAAAGTMTATMEVLVATRTIAGEARGAESLRAAIDELGTTRDHLLAQARSLQSITAGG